MRTRIRERAAHLREVAGLHDTAADSLDRSAAPRSTGSRTASPTASDAPRPWSPTRASGRTPGVEPGGGRGRIEPTEDDSALAFVHTAAGHRDWLTVDLPGGL
ncbi:MAG: hypothetical protein R2734_04705 [Nocardioides sp.]